MAAIGYAPICRKRGLTRIAFTLADPPLPDPTFWNVQLPHVRYRLIYAGLGFLTVAVLSLCFVFGQGGDPITLPAPLERISPQPYDAVPMQSSIEVDLEVGYAARIYVDGYPIPRSELSFSDGVGIYRWRPSDRSLLMDRWPVGEHTISVVWEKTYGLPDVGEFSWTFRVQ